MSSPDGLNILRHSAAHVLAQAVQSINPDAKLGIGPPITDGFYYDFDVQEPFTPEAMKALEKAMERIIRSGQRFVRRVTDDSSASIELANEPYKIELIGIKGNADAVGEGSAEVGAGELTIYDNIDPQSGEVMWSDLCRGPHLPNTRMIGNGFALTRVAAAYWRGNEKNKQLSESMEPHGLQRMNYAPTKSAWKRPLAEITASSAKSWTCFPSLRKLVPVWPSFIQRAESFVA
jgi:threonyl-tRNA synthetase